MAKYEDLKQALKNPSDVTELVHRAKDGEEEPPSAIAELTKLERLDLRGSEIETLPAWLANMPALTALALSCENLKDASVLPKIAGLSHVDLNGMPAPKELWGLRRLTSLKLYRGDADLLIPDEIYSSFPDLEAFQSAGYEMKVFDPRILEWTKLRELSIQGGGLKKVPASIGTLRTLTSLSIGGQSDLGELPDEIGDLSALRSLQLIANRKLPRLPASLSKLRDLEVLNLSSCEKLKAIPKGMLPLPKLERLFLNALPALAGIPEGLAECSSLRELGFYNAAPSLDSLEPLRGTALQKLDLSGLPAEIDLSPLGTLVTLEDLNLKSGVSGKKSSFRFLSTLTSLKKLDLSSNYGVKKLQGLETLTSLEELDVSGTPIRDLGPIAGLKKLRVLKTDGCGVKDIAALAELTELEELAIDDAKNPDLTFLENLKKLKSLSASKAGVTDLEPLAGLIALEFLNLDRNKIKDVTPLAGLVNLRDLLLEDNKDLEDVTPLAGLKDLQCLQLGGTAVKDFSPVEFVPDLAR